MDKNGKAQTEQTIFALPPKAGLPDLRTSPAASSSRMPPSRPRASPRSRASACDPHDAQRRASTAMVGLLMRQQLHDAPGDGTVGKHVVVVIASFAGGARGLRRV